MQTTETMTETQQRQQAVQGALIQVRLEGMEPHPLAFDLMDRYIQGLITIEDALAVLKQAVQVSSHVK